MHDAHGVPPPPPPLRAPLEAARASERVSPGEQKTRRRRRRRRSPPPPRFLCVSPPGLACRLFRPRVAGSASALARIAPPVVWRDAEARADAEREREAAVSLASLFSRPGAPCKGRKLDRARKKRTEMHAGGEHHGNVPVIRLIGGRAGCGRQGISELGARAAMGWKRLLLRVSESPASRPRYDRSSRSRGQYASRVDHHVHG